MKSPITAYGIEFSMRPGIKSAKYGDGAKYDGHAKHNQTNVIASPTDFFSRTVLLEKTEKPILDVHVAWFSHNGNRRYLKQCSTDQQDP